MDFLSILIVIGLVFYVIYLSSRVSKIETFLASKNIPGTNGKSMPMAAADQKKTPAFQSIEPVKNTPAKTTASIPQRPTPPGEAKTFIDYLPKVGVVALLFGIGFFLKYAIDQGWIGIWMRLIIGGAIGTLLIVLYTYWKDKYEKYAIALAGGGLAIWYITIYAAVQMYGLVDIYFGLVIMALITLITLVLAEKNKSMALSAIAWSGAFLTPLILSLSSQSLVIFLIYLGILTVGLFAMVWHSKNNVYFVIQFVGIVVNMIWGYAVGPVIGHFYGYYLVFFFAQLASTTLFLSYLMNGSKETLTEEAKKEFALLLFVPYVIFAMPALMIARSQFEDYSILIVTLTGLWTYLIYAYIDRIENKVINYLLSFVGALMFVVALMWQFTGNTQTIVVYALGLLGIIIGAFRHRAELRVWGLCIVLFGIMLAIAYPYEKIDALILSVKFGLEMLGVLALGFAYVLFKEDQLTEFEKGVHRMLLYLISGLVWFLVTWDIINFYNFDASGNERNLLISLWWLIWAVILIVGSIKAAFRPLRKVSLLLFGLVIVKVFLYDVAALEMAYRIVSFISLGVILLIVSFAYQHNKEKIKEYLQ